MSDEEYVSQREFARRVDRSHVWVNRLVKNGILPSNDKKQIPFNAGMEAYKAEFQIVDEDLVEHNKKQRKRGKRKRGVSRSTKKKSTKTDVTIEEAPSAPATSEGISTAKLNEQYNRARLAEKTYDAKLKELKFKEAEGLLIPIDDVKADAARTGAEVREKLFGIPSRVAGRCEGKSAREIERIIDEAINEALTALKRSRFGHGK